jgi:hypothetical protein
MKYLVSAAVACLLLPAKQVMAVDSHVKMRVNKDFVKEVLSNNLASFFERAASKDMEDIAIKEINSKLTGA